MIRTGGRRARRGLPALLLACALLSLYPLLRRDAENREGERAPPALESPARGGLAYTARVARVVDGDTLLLSRGERVRLLGIDAPEKDSPLYLEASRACRELVEERTVRLEVSRGAARDAYGRTLAWVFSGGLCLNEELLARGLARVYLKGDADLETGVVRRLVDLQAGAIDRRLGLWGLPGALSTRPGERLVETRFRYHRAGCPSLGAGRRGPLPPTTREAALRAGKSPCRTCNPRRRHRRHFGRRRSLDSPGLRPCPRGPAGPGGPGGGAT
jgi:endonuclease YncB( thermonuclease family)